MPRNIFVLALALVTLIALGVRIWGIAYDNLSCYHHDERIHLRTALKFHQGVLNPRPIWSQQKFLYVFYPWLSMYLVAFFYWAFIFLRWAAAVSGVCLAQLTAFRPGVVFPACALLGEREALLLGRLAVAGFGAATIPILGSAGAAGWGKRAGLLAAGLLAFNGYHIGNCHWMKNDVIALFFLVLAFRWILAVVQRGGPKDYLWAGIFSALAVGAKWNNAPILGVFALAHGLRASGEEGSLPRRWLSGRLLRFVLAFAAVVVISYPLLYLEWSYVVSNLGDLIARSRSHAMFGGLEASARPLSFWQIRWNNLANFARFSASMTAGMGWYVSLLGGLGLVSALARRRPRELLLASFPLLYLVSAILTASPGIRYQDTIPLYPFFALLAAVVLRDVCARVSRRPVLSAALMGAAGLLLLFPYVFSSARMDYGYWQPSTAEFGSAWVLRNVPPGSSFVRESKTVSLPSRIYQVGRVRAVWGTDPGAIERSTVEYLVIAASHEQRALEKTGLFGPDHPFGRTYLALPQNYDLIKEFDLGDIPYKTGGIKIYRRKQPDGWSGRGLNSALLRSFNAARSLVSPPVLFLNPQGECEGETNFVLGPGATKERWLVSPSPLNELGVRVENGPRPGAVTVTAGGKTFRTELAAGEGRQFIACPRTSFPFIGYSYRVRVENRGEGHCLVKVLSDRIGIALGDLSDKRESAARARLEEALAASPDDRYLRYLCVRAAPGSEPAQPPKALDELRRSADPGERLGFPAPWLEKRAGMVWEEAALGPTANKAGGIRWQPPESFYLPSGDYTLRVRFSPSSPPSAQRDFLVRLYRSGRLDREWRVESAGEGEQPFAFSCAAPGEEAFFMVESSAGNDGRVLEASVSPSFKAWLAALEL